jgi:hypothetical protein
MSFGIPTNLKLKPQFHAERLERLDIKVLFGLDHFVVGLTGGHPKRHPPIPIFT